MSRLAPLFVLAFAIPMVAWSPPQDTAGPLTVRIEGPSTLTQTGSPFGITVVLENKGDATLQGALRIGLIDGWQAEPAGAQEFAVDAHAATRREVRIAPAARTYNAHYPVHVFAEFAFNGQTLTAHPVLIVETRLANPPRATVPVEWRPFELAANRSLALWRLPVSRTIIQIFNQAEPKLMPVNWQGSEETTRANVQFGARIQRGDSRETIGIHPPWYQGRTGTALVEFPLRLPESKLIKLQFANALRDHNPERERPSDGVTFRVRVARSDAPDGAQGEVIFERNADAKVWLDGEADLTRFAGQSIRLQLESHPGPKNDTSVDQSYWAEPTITAGTPPQPVAFPPASAAGSRLLGSIEQGNERYEARVWPGERGLLDSAIGIGRLRFNGFRARVLGDALEDWRSAAALLSVREETSGGRYRVRHSFRSWAGEFDLMGEVWAERTQMKAHFWIEKAPEPKPWLAVYLEDLSVGAWTEKARRVYAGTGNVLEDPKAFRLGFDGHRLSTSFVGLEFENGLSLVQAVDTPPSSFDVDPATKNYSLHTPHEQTLAFVPAAGVWDAVKTWRSTNGLRSAGGVDKLAGRFVFDLWGGRYADAARAVRRAASYGLLDSILVWHNWQRWGYDYRLPDIYPPNPLLGTLEEMLDLARAAKDNGILFAPHDNYIDFYPDAEGFSYDHIAAGRDGAPVRAWLNEGRQAQSYRWRADRFGPFLERNLRAIRDGFAPTGYFIDVWSSAGPYDYWTPDGQFFPRLFTRKVWGESFAWIRDLLGGNAPQISESGHDQLIGWLDGAQTNHLRVDRPPAGEYSWAVWNIGCADAERIPWFDAAHHDRFVLHGAGYESRYASGLNTRLHGIYSDDYITTEVLTGHPGMAKSAFGRDVVRKYWLLHDLMRELALRRIENVEFVGGNLHRQYVRWDNGGEVWVNRGPEDWTVAGRVLPEYGFYARAPAKEGVVEAAIERREGVIVDWARSPWLYHVNARPVVSDRLPIRVALDSIAWLGDRRFHFNLRWETEGAFPAGYRVFVHFVDSEGKILFQGDHNAPLSAGAGTYSSGADVAIPAQFTTGQTVEMRIGFYNPGGGARLLPEGPDDGTSRVRLGSIVLQGQGTALTGVDWKPFEAPPDAALARLNPDGRPVSFEGVTTDGALRLSAAGDTLWLTALPEGRKKFAARIHWAGLPWKLPIPREVEAVDEEGNARNTSSVVRQDGDVVVVLDPSVHSYRLR